MNARIVNLRTRRKQKARQDRKAEADENAAKHGQPKAVRDLAEARKELEARRLDGHRRNDDDA